MLWGGNQYVSQQEKDGTAPITVYVGPKSDSVSTQFLQKNESLAGKHLRC